MEHIARAAIRQQGGQISDDLTVVVVDMLPSGTNFPEVASSLVHSPNSGSLGSAGRPSRVKSSSGLKSFFRCTSEPSVLEEFEPSFHDPTVRDPSQRGRGDHSNHANVHILADIDSYIEFAHLSPMSVARQQQQQQLSVQQQQQPQSQQTYVSPFAQPNLARDSSDSASSSVYIHDNGPHANGVGQQPLRHMDYTTHAGGQMPTTHAGRTIPPGQRNLQSVSQSNTGLVRTSSRGSSQEEATAQHAAKQSTVHNVPVLGKRGNLGDSKRKSMGDKVLSRVSLGARPRSGNLSRISLGARPKSGHLDRISATHYGAETPSMVPLRMGSGPPDKMIVDPTTHAEAGFRRRRSGATSGDLDVLT